MRKIFALVILCVFVCLQLRAENATIDNIMYLLDEETMEACISGNSLSSDNTDGNIVIPETIVVDEKTYSVTSVGSSAFRRCWVLTSIELPNSIKHIYHLSAFDGCTSLKRVVLPNGITEIPRLTFNACMRLSDFKLPESVILIAANAFTNCYELKSIDFGPNLRSIAIGAFSGSGLINVVIPDDVNIQGGKYMGAFSDCKSLESIKLPANQTSVPQETLKGCVALKSVDIPDECRFIDEEAFAGCVSLTEIVIPEAVETIHSNAFAGCTNLNVIYLGKQPKTMSRAGGDGLCIKTNAFKDCPNINKIVCTSPVPPTIEEGVFDDGVLENTTIYVPEDYVDAYKNNPEWNKGKIVEGTPSGIENIVADANAETEIYTVSGVKVGNNMDNMPAGIYILRQGTRTRKVVVK